LKFQIKELECQNEIERIKEPFKTGFSQGVGLGLSVVRRIIEQHNGRIEIESKYKEGTTVKLYFRAKAMIRKILIVDDEKSMVSMLKILFEKKTSLLILHQVEKRRLNSSLKTIMTL